MNHDLDGIYAGPLENITPLSISAEGVPNCVHAPALLDPKALGKLLDRAGAQYQYGDRRAVASLWSKWHFSGVIIPSLAANLLLARELPVGLRNVQVKLSREGYTETLVIPHAGRPLVDTSPVGRFTTLVQEHLEPFSQALADASGASPRVFWSNAGNYFEYTARVIESHPLGFPGASSPALALLETEWLPDGRRNPLYQPVRYVAADLQDGCHRVRRLCCIRYLIDDLDYCENCPLENRTQSVGSAPIR